MNGCGGRCAGAKYLAGVGVKTELVSASGAHILDLAGPMARAMVTGGAAEVANANGKVKSVRLVATATSFAQMIGSPSDGRATGVRFTRWMRLEESATLIIEHHPPCTYPWREASVRYYEADSEMA
jgi:hypothetical protein